MSEQCPNCNHALGMHVPAGPCHQHTGVGYCGCNSPTPIPTDLATAAERVAKYLDARARIPWLQDSADLHGFRATATYEGATLSVSDLRALLDQHAAMEGALQEIAARAHRIARDVLAATAGGGK